MITIIVSECAPSKCSTPSAPRVAVPVCVSTRPISASIASIIWLLSTRWSASLVRQLKLLVGNDAAGNSAIGGAWYGVCADEYETVAIHGVLGGRIAIQSIARVLSMTDR